jgi:hypothetical protein
VDDLLFVGEEQVEGKLQSSRAHTPSSARGNIICVLDLRRGPQLMDEPDDPLGETIKRLNREAEDASLEREMEETGEAAVVQYDQETRAERTHQILEWTRELVDGMLGIRGTPSPSPTQEAGPISYAVVSEDPARRLILRFAFEAGTVAVQQGTTTDGQDLTEVYEVVLLDATSETIKKDLESILRWLWATNPPDHPQAYTADNGGHSAPI